jgi:hypothetical protein
LPDFYKKINLIPSSGYYSLSPHQLLVMLAIAGETPIFQYEMDAEFYFGAIPAGLGDADRYKKTIGGRVYAFCLEDYLAIHHGWWC